MGGGTTEEEVARSAWHLGEGVRNRGRERLGGPWPAGRTAVGGGRELRGVSWDGGGDLEIIGSPKTQVH